MTKISNQDVQNLARLSSLQLSQEETDSLGQDISRILEYVEQLDQLDTTGVEPTYQVTGLDNVWRDDVVRQDDVSREQLLELAPESDGQYIKVPKVL